MKFLVPLAILLLSLNTYAKDRLCLLNETDQEIHWTIFQNSSKRSLINFPSPSGHTYQCEVMANSSNGDILVFSRGKDRFSCSAANVKVNDVIAVKKLKNGLDCRSLRKDPTVSISIPGDKIFLNTLSLDNEYKNSYDFVAFFSPLLVARSLQTQNSVPVTTFEAGKGIGPIKSISLSDIDLNIWSLQALKLLDDVLIYHKEIKFVDTRLSTNFYKKLIDIKDRLIKVLSSNIDSVLTTPELNRDNDKIFYDMASDYFEGLFKFQLSRAFAEEALIISSDTDASKIPPVLIRKSVPSLTYLNAKWVDRPQSSLSNWARVYYKFDYPSLQLSDSLELTLLEAPEEIRITNTKKKEFFNVLASIELSRPAFEQSIKDDLGIINGNHDEDSLLRTKILLGSLITLMEPLPRHWATFPETESNNESGLKIDLKEKSYPLEGNLALVISLSYQGDSLDLIPEFEGFKTEAGPVKSSFVFRDSEGRLLDWARSQKLLRSLIFRTNIFSKYTLKSRTVSNREGFSNNTVKPVFHLFGKSSLQNLKRPFIEKNERIDLQQLIPLEGKISLAQYLGFFMKDFLGTHYDDSADYSVRMSVTYEINDSPISLPVFILPNLPFSSAQWMPQDCPSQDNTPCLIQAQLENWKQQINPRPGKFIFDITFLVKEQGRVIPLMKASNLYLVD